jgi:hypothetical protein
MTSTAIESAALPPRPPKPFKVELTPKLSPRRSSTAHSLQISAKKSILSSADKKITLPTIKPSRKRIDFNL